MKKYSLYQIAKNGKKFFYVKFVDDETGKQLSPKSVEVLRKKLGISDRHHITKRPEAEYIVQKAIEKGLDGVSNNIDPLFIDYLLSFWDWEKSPYIERMNAGGQIRVGKDYVSNNAGNIKNHIERFRESYTVKNLLGEMITKQGFLNDLRCSQLKRTHIKDMQEVIIREKGVNIWANCKRALSVPIKELIRDYTLLIDPMTNINDIPVSTKSSVGTLTKREMEKLIISMFNDVNKGHIFYINRGSKKGTKQVEGTFKLDNRVYLASVLSAFTGMRKGEILGLKVGAIRYPNNDDKFETEAIIDVKEAFAKKQGFKTPKNRKTRKVPVPKWLADDLIKFAMTNPKLAEQIGQKTEKNEKEIIENSLVFYSDYSNKPYDPKTIDKWFNRELCQIGIDETERRNRHLVFHSLRHFFNTEAIALVGADITRVIMGHSDSNAMTERYFNGADDNTILQAGLTIQTLLPNPHTYIDSVV